MEQKFHIPVMCAEAIDFLNLSAGKTIVDATLGTGGHSLKILERISPGGRLIGIDRDEAAINIAKARLADYGGSCSFLHGNFSDIDKMLAGLAIDKVDGILFDLGVSSLQFDNPLRGFSFQGDGPLDMRLDQTSHISAYDLVNNLNEDELSELLWNFGQERWHNRIARYLVKEREKSPISTTKELSRVVIEAIPYRFRHGRIHAATRTFQALRVAVNRELESLEIAVHKALQLLKENGRICVISFHSLEDRVVKFSFRDAAAKGMLKIMTPKPLVPSEQEAAQNPRARSAKFRAGERIVA